MPKPLSESELDITLDKLKTVLIRLGKNPDEFKGKAKLLPDSFIEHLNGMEVKNKA